MLTHDTFSVHPKYTPGSPAQVDRETAFRVARQEVEAWEAAHPGVDILEHGEVDLSEIVVSYRDGRDRRYVRDRVTGKAWYVPLKHVSAEHPFGDPRHRIVTAEHS